MNCMMKADETMQLIGANECTIVSRSGLFSATHNIRTSTPAHVYHHLEHLGIFAKHIIKKNII